MTETRTGALVHGLDLESAVTACCGLEPTALPDEDQVVEVAPELAALVSCAGRCRRCGERPGRERYYQPGQLDEISFSLAGVTPKVSVKQTVGCDPCWAGFIDLRRETGYPDLNGGSDPPVRTCCGQRHDGPDCPDGLVMCQLCFERVHRERLHVLDDGSLEDVCAICAAQEAAATARANRPLWRWWVLLRRGARDWVLYTLVWLVGLALVVIGGGFDGIVAAVGLVAVGVGGGLFIHWLWEVLS